MQSSRVRFNWHNVESVVSSRRSASSNREVGSYTSRVSEMSANETDGVASAIYLG